MRPETASLRSLTHPGSLALLEQNFDFDLLTPAKLLEKYVGRERAHRQDATRRPAWNPSRPPPSWRPTAAWC